METIENLRELELDIISKIDWVHYFPILQPYKLNSFLLLFSEKNILNLLCLDRDGNTLFEKKDLIKNKNIEDFTELKFGP